MDRKKKRKAEMASKLQLLLVQLLKSIPSPTPAYTSLTFTPTAPLATTHVSTHAPATDSQWLTIIQQLHSENSLLQRQLTDLNNRYIKA